MIKPDLSIIITAHHEGLVAHKTMLAVFRAVSCLDRANISYEIIVNLDNPDQCTKKYYKQYENKPKMTLLRTSFGNPADARNNAISYASAPYISVLDGDDLISENWFLESYRLATSQTDPAIIHPNAHLHFGLHELNESLWLMHDSLPTKAEEALRMVHWNPWTFAITTQTSVLKKFPFKAPKDGFGYEDYHFNSETVAAGIRHLVAPKTVLFYRRMTDSMQATHISEKTTLRYTKLLDTNFIKSIPLLPFPRLKSKRQLIKKVAKELYHLGGRAIKHFPSLQSRFVPITKSLLTRGQKSNIPNFVISEWQNINAIENQLYPTTNAVANLTFHPLSFNLNQNSSGVIYRYILEYISKNPDYIFLPPELSIGGTEKVIFNYLYAIKKAHPDWHIVVFGKLPPAHHYDVPEQVDFVDFDGLTKKMSLYEKDILFSRLIIQLKIKRLHIFGSGFADKDFYYNWVSEHQKLLGSNGYQLNISWFMREYAHEKNRIQTFADPYLAEIYDATSKIFTDNQTVIDECLLSNAFDPEKFIVHYQPEKTELAPPKLIKTARRPLKILWASRLSFQKRPDILKAVAKKLSPEDFKIDAYGRPQHYKKNYFNDIKNIDYKGAFNGIDAIPINDYDVFLYTSEVDGLPNIVLEVAARGLPIVASNDGGVGEFVIDKQTGLLVDIEDVDGYIEALRYILTNPEQAESMALKAQRLLKTRHSEKAFNQQVANDIH